VTIVIKKIKDEVRYRTLVGVKFLGNVVPRVGSPKSPMACPRHFSFLNVLLYYENGNLLPYLKRLYLYQAGFLFLHNKMIMTCVLVEVEYQFREY
jgi:hypothetical protein